MTNKSWITNLKIGDSVIYINKEQQQRNIIKIINIKNICIVLANGDIVDNIDGENLHRTHQIVPIETAR